MIIGIGVDVVSISELTSLKLRISETAFNRIFTDAELACVTDRSHPYEYLAGRFAAKEAVFKAVSPALNGVTFDLRMVETLSRPDGSPYIHVNDELRSILERAEVSRVHISITAEGDMAAAFAIAENEAE